MERGFSSSWLKKVWLSHMVGVETILSSSSAHNHPLELEEGFYFNLFLLNN